MYQSCGGDIRSFCSLCSFKHSPLCSLNNNKMNCELMLTYDTPALWQTGSRNLTGPKALPTIWYTYMMLVTKYHISVINSYWEKCDEKYLGRTEVKQYTPSPFGERGYKYTFSLSLSKFVQKFLLYLPSFGMITGRITYKINEEKKIIISHF